MLLFINYKNELNEVIHAGKYTSQTHREYHEGKNSQLLEFTPEDVSAAEIRKLKIGHRVSRLQVFNPYLIAEIGVINEEAMDAETMTEEQYTSFKSKIAVVKDHLTDAAYDKAIASLGAADLTEIAPEVKAAFIAKMQAIVDSQTAELNPPDSFLQEAPA